MNHSGFFKGVEYEEMDKLLLGNINVGRNAMFCQ